eukprot:3040908-Ditylum_brightwellii.AAC.1
MVEGGPITADAASNIGLKLSRAGFSAEEVERRNRLKKNIDVGHDAFVALKEDMDEAELTMEQLVESGAVETAVSLF